MFTSNKALLHRWFEEVWNKKREASIYEMLDPEAVVFGLSDSPVHGIRGPGEFLPFWRKFTLAMPNLAVVVESLLEEDEKAAARCSVRATHTGEGLGIAPTGAEIAFTGMVIARINDGRIIQAWNNFDFLSFYQQLGIVKLPG